MNDGRSPEKEKLGLMHAMGLVVQLGLTLAVIVGGSVYVGILLDRKAGTGWMFTAGLSLLGIVSGFYALYRMVMRTSD